MPVSDIQTGEQGINLEAGSVWGGRVGRVRETVKRERSAKGKGTFRVTSASRAQTLRHLAEASVFGHPLTLRLSARLARAVSVEDPSGKDVLMIPVRFSVIW